ncbi:MAG: hypothetical protein DLM55_08470 [Acidimicrobiales bacterium]|nr:MAG: hypothetical protein DLM55_08470 [Acidimicrobiales bacterium]
MEFIRARIPGITGLKLDICGRVKTATTTLFGCLGTPMIACGKQEKEWEPRASVPGSFGSLGPKMTFAPGQTQRYTRKCMDELIQNTPILRLERFSST